MSQSGVTNIALSDHSVIYFTKKNSKAKYNKEFKDDKRLLFV